MIMADDKTCSPEKIPSSSTNINVALSDDENARVQPHQISKSRKSLLLFIFCLAQFLDTFNVSSLYTALPTISARLNMTGGESTWLISAYQLSLASCLLIGGRISDVYRPGPVFITGATGLSLLSIAAGFLREKIVLIVFRALLGICAALTIPSALALIIHFFPDPKEQARAIGGFGGCGTIGIGLGLIFGSLLTQDASWPWVLWFIAVAAAPVALGGFLFVPGGVSSRTRPSELKGFEKFKSIDILGAVILTAALVLFVFSMVSGSIVGWKTAQTLVSLFISIGLVIIFFFWETKLPEGSAAIPPKMWFYPNFTLLIVVSLVPYALANLCFVVYTNYWQNVLGWSIISTAVHLLPIVVATIFGIILVIGPLQHLIIRKWFLLSGMLIMVAALVLLVFANSGDRYWSLVFPAFVLGSLGFTFVYMHANVALFHVTPPSASGTVGAMLNGINQLGSAIGVAIVTSIVLNIDDSQTGTSPTQRYAGSAAAFEFYIGIMGFATLCVFLFYKDISGTPRLGENSA